MTLSRSIYASKLGEFGDFVFAERGTTRCRGEWRAFFAERIGASFDGRVILEIGCYNAKFLSDIAAGHPTTAFVGLDWKCRQLYDGARHIVEKSIRNVALLRARAQDIATMFGPGEVDEIWIFHPEPLAEAHEIRNRLISESFLRDAHAVLRDAGSICLKTDHRGYYDWTLEIGHHIGFHSANYWNDPAAIARTKDRAFAGRVTTYEQRFLRKNQPIYYVEWLKD